MFSTPCNLHVSIEIRYQPTISKCFHEMRETAENEKLKKWLLKAHIIFPLTFHFFRKIFYFSWFFFCVFNKFKLNFNFNLIQKVSQNPNKSLFQLPFQSLLNSSSSCKIHTLAHPNSIFQWTTRRQHIDFGIENSQEKVS